MQYMLLIYSNEADDAKMHTTEAEQQLQCDEIVCAAI